MSSPRAAATGWRSDANRSRRVSQEYNLPHVLHLKAVADFALRVMAVRDAGTARSSKACRGSRLEATEGGKSWPFCWHRFGRILLAPGLRPLLSGTILLPPCPIPGILAGRFSSTCDLLNARCAALAYAPEPRRIGHDLRGDPRSRHRDAPAARPPDLRHPEAPVPARRRGLGRFEERTYRGPTRGGR